MNTDKLSLDDVIANHEKLKVLSENYNDKRGAFYNAKEHGQLAEWLKDYKRLLEFEKSVLAKEDGYLATMCERKGYNKAREELKEEYEEKDENRNETK